LPIKAIGTSQAYKDKIKTRPWPRSWTNLPAGSTTRIRNWWKRKFEDLIFINGGLTPDTAWLTEVVPENFATSKYLAEPATSTPKTKDFWQILQRWWSSGTVCCNVWSEPTQQVTKNWSVWLAVCFHAKLGVYGNRTGPGKSRPAIGFWMWAIRGLRAKIIENTAIGQHNRPDYFPFLFSTISKPTASLWPTAIFLDMNGVDAKLTLGENHKTIGNSRPELYFKYGFAGCQIGLSASTTAQIPYGQSD